MSPKQKTKKAALKRFKMSAGGRILRRQAMKSHNLEKKSAKRKRAFRRDQPLAGKDTREVKRLLGR
ncbi:MAG TPA: 50S ribosomal protein L35 [Gaiellaceae bacterium]|jgi:large subunit ribosomal protein L35